MIFILPFLLSVVYSTLTIVPQPTYRSPSSSDTESNPSLSDLLLAEHDRSFGSCICDLFSVQCDFGCFCDDSCSHLSVSDVSDSLTERFRFGSDVFHSDCVPYGPLISNLPGRVEIFDETTGAGADDEGSSQVDGSSSSQFCIREKIEEMKRLGNVFDVVDELSEKESFEMIQKRSQLAKFAVRGLDNFGRTWDDFGVNDVAERSHYRVGERIPYRVWVAGALERSESQFWGLGLNGDVAVENCMRTVAFGVNMAVSCTVRLDKLDQLCNQTASASGSVPLDTNSWTKDVWLSVYQGNVSDVSQIEIAEVDGAPTATANPPVFVANTDGSSCTNSLVRVAFAVSGDVSMTITEVKAYVETATLRYNSSSPLLQFQEVEFSVVWLNPGQEWSDFANGNVREKSGSSGYVDGEIVLSGRHFSVGEMNAIEQRTTGFSLPRSGQRCDRWITGEERKSVVVRFGEDFVTSCWVSVSSVTDLRNLCQENFTNTFDLNSEIESFVGIYGDSDFHYPGDWIEIPPVTPWLATFDNGATTCHLVPTLVSFEFVIARQGSISDPQWKIVEVRKTVSTTDWERRSDATGVQIRSLYWRVSFIELVS